VWGGETEDKINEGKWNNAVGPIPSFFHGGGGGNGGDRKGGCNLEYVRKETILAILIWRMGGRKVLSCPRKRIMEEGGPRPGVEME